MRRPLGRTAAAAVAAAFLIAACSSGPSATDTPSAPPPTSAAPGETTTPVEPPSTTTPAGGTASPAPPPETASTPDEAAQGLFAAWQRNDPGGAERYADDQAIAVLFERAYTEPAPSFFGCAERDAGWDCSYTYEGGAIRMFVQRSEDAFRVHFVAFLAD